MKTRATKIRIRKVRGDWEIITYTAGARGSKKRVGTVQVGSEGLDAALHDPANREKLGIPPHDR
jgi:hypothetical protein